MFCCRRQAKATSPRGGGGGIEQDWPLLGEQPQAAKPEETSGERKTGSDAFSTENLDNDPTLKLPPEKDPGGKLCPLSGLIGVCPMAKPRVPLKEGEKPPELRVLMLLFWEEDASKVSIGIYPHNSQHWEALGLPDNSSKEEIRQRYRKLALKHHPDKNPDDPVGAKERFQPIKDAYAILRETDGELAFRWEKFPDRQHEMTGRELLKTFGHLGKEASSADPIKAQMMTHVVREATDCKVLLYERETLDGVQRTNETWADCLCSDSKCEPPSTHLIKVYRRIVSMDFDDEDGGLDDDTSTMAETNDGDANDGDADDVDTPG